MPQYNTSIISEFSMADDFKVDDLCIVDVWLKPACCAAGEAEGERPSHASAHPPLEFGQLRGEELDEVCDFTHLNTRRTVEQHQLLVPERTWVNSRTVILSFPSAATESSLGSHPPAPLPVPRTTRRESIASPDGIVRRTCIRCGTGKLHAPLPAREPAGLVGSLYSSSCPLTRLRIAPRRSPT